MATNVTNVISHFPEAENGFTTTLASTISASATTVPLNSVSGYTNGKPAVFVVDPTDAVKKQTFTGIIDTAGVQVTDVIWTAGNDQTHTAGATVVDYATATHISMVSKGISVQHLQTGTHGVVTATSLSAPNATLTNATITNLTVGTQAPSVDWTTVATAPDTVTYNGQRSYSLVFNGVDYTNILSPGQRLKTTRTVAAPTQCTSLNGTTQYYSKTTPSKLTFTTVFTCSAWVKLSSYAAGGIIARRNASTEGWAFRVNADGTLYMAGLRIASNNKVTQSVQSLPLNKWVHVAATLDMAAGDTTAQKFWIDGVEVPRTYTLTGTATVLVQGTTALVVGAADSAGVNPFPGKIAQAAVFDAALSDATIKAMANQTLTGAETNLLSGYSFNNSVADLNQTNANDLAPQGSAVATNADSPFGTQASGLISATLDYGIVQSAVFSTNTTVVVQVPEGCTIPTSGGVSAIAYSGLKTPYGFPPSADRWMIETYDLAAAFSQSSPVSGTWYNTGNQLTVPIGRWYMKYICTCGGADSSGSPSGIRIRSSISTVNNAGDILFQAGHTWSHTAAAGADGITTTLSGEGYLSVTTATIYYLNVKSDLGSTDSLNTSSAGIIFMRVENAYL